MNTLTIDCRLDGSLQFVWSDDLSALVGEGQASIRRVSDVEPDAHGRWWADLGRVGGPVLGPFSKRGAAVEAELEWLNNRS